MKNSTKIGIFLAIVVLLFGAYYAKNRPVQSTSGEAEINTSSDMSYDDALANEKPTLLEFFTST